MKTRHQIWFLAVLLTLLVINVVLFQIHGAGNIVLPIGSVFDGREALPRVLASPEPARILYLAVVCLVARTFSRRVSRRMRAQNQSAAHTRLHG